MWNLNIKQFWLICLLFAIHITINGYAKVRWTERKSRRSGNRTVHYTETYTAHEQYLFSRTYVFGQEGGGSIEFPAGTHTYNFQVQLPLGLPSAFAGRHGHIRYDVVLTIDRPWRFDNTFMQPFTVISTLDLNANPVYKLPLQQEQVKEFSCGCCNIQPIRVRVHIPFSGFAPGQKIPISVLVQNESSVNCYASKIKLEKTVRFTATSPYSKSKFDTLKVAEKHLGAVPRLTNKEFKELIAIPAIPPSTLATCRIIEVTYILSVRVYTSGCHRNAEIVFPITVGTYPLRESATNPMNVVTVQPTAPPNDGREAPVLFPPNAIHIEILGHAKVRWTKERIRRKPDGKTELYTVTFSAYEQYLSSRTYIVDSDCGNSFEFQPGRYPYNFEVQLPARLPSSIEGRYGHVRYEVVLTVDRPWKFDNVFKKCFTVIETLNLNLDPIYKQPIYSEDTKTFCCGCCNDEFIKVTCRIPFSGYCPGQKVPFTILVENESTVECYNSKIKLEKTVKFTARSPKTEYRYETSKVLEKELGPVRKTSNEEFKDFIQLPSIPPSSCNPGHIIDVYYMVTVKVQTSGCHANAELTFPIKIGTVPLIESATNPATVVTIQPTAPQMPGRVVEDAPPPYLGNEPPSYENATAEEGQMTDDEDDKHVKKEPFVPKYPVYYNFAAPSAPPSEQPSASAPLLNTEQSALPAIYIEIRGNGKVSFSESQSQRRWDGRTEYYTQVYTGEEEYLATRQYMVGNERSQSFELPAGTYTYSFQTPLPLNLPSTVEGEHGHVGYEVVLVIDRRPWKYDNIFKNRFVVIQTLNLNMDSKYKIPAESEDVNSICCGSCCCCCCCGNENITLKCRIPFSGYAPGQKLPFSILVKNESTVECEVVQIKLQKIMTFTTCGTNRKTRETTTIVVGKDFGPIPKMCNREFKDFLQIPPVPPSSADPGHVIDVSYKVHVEAVTEGCHCNPLVNLPITIGTVPLLATAENPSNVVTVQPTAPQMSFDGDSPPPYFANAPPSYEAVTSKERFMSDEEDDKYIEKQPFVPKYPVYYNFGAQAAPTTSQPSPANVPSLLTGPAMPALPTMPIIPTMPTPTQITTDSESTYAAHETHGNRCEDTPPHSPDVNCDPVLRIIPDIIDLVID